MKKNSGSELNQTISGPICPLPTSKGDALYKGGALSSAFVSVVL